MPKQTFQKGSLVKMIGDKGTKAHEAHKKDAVTESAGGQVPPFEDGIAKLISCRFGVFGKGEFKDQPYWQARFTVVEPEFTTAEDGSGRKIRIRGRQFGTNPEALVDTPKKSRKTFQEHYAWMLDKIKKLLGVQGEVSFGFNEIESVCESIEKNPPYINCRAWRGEPTLEFPKPQVNYEIIGKAVDYVPGANTSVKDKSGEADTPTVESSGGTSNSAASADTSAAVTDYSQEEDLDILIEGCENTDDSAIERIGKLGTEAGLTDQEIEDAADWPALKEMILKKRAEGKADKAAENLNPNWTAHGKLADDGDSDIATKMQEEAEARGIDHNKYKTWAALGIELDKPVAKEEAPAIKVGGIVFHKPYSKKLKKHADKAVECEVTAVDEKEKTAAIKALAGKDNWKGVPFDQLTFTA